MRGRRLRPVTGRFPTCHSSILLPSPSYKSPSWPCTKIGDRRRGRWRKVASQGLEGVKLQHEGKELVVAWEGTLLGYERPVGPKRRSWATLDNPLDQAIYRWVLVFSVPVAGNLPLRSRFCFPLVFFTGEALPSKDFTPQRRLKRKT